MGSWAPSGDLIPKSEFKMHTNTLGELFYLKTMDFVSEVWLGSVVKEGGNECSLIFLTLSSLRALTDLNKRLTKTFKLVSWLVSQ